MAYERMQGLDAAVCNIDEQSQRDVEKLQITRDELTTLFVASGSQARKQFTGYI